VLFTVVASPALAQGPAHPQAGHAISDLQAARDFLSRGGPHGVSPADNQAIGLIDQVIASSQRVVEYDHSRLHVDERLGADRTASTPNRHENALLMMEAAQRDLSLPESNSVALPYRQQARQQLSEAIQIVQRQQAAHAH
jgi:hypothetical protein